jgi:hypothetical protein
LGFRTRAGQTREIFGIFRAHYSPRNVWGSDTATEDTKSTNHYLKNGHYVHDMKFAKEKISAF